MTKYRSIIIDRTLRKLIVDRKITDRNINEYNTIEYDIVGKFFDVFWRKNDDTN